MITNKQEGLVAKKLKLTESHILGGSISFPSWVIGGWMDRDIIVSRRDVSFSRDRSILLRQSDHSG